MFTFFDNSSFVQLIYPQKHRDSEENQTCFCPCVTSGKFDHLQFHGVFSRMAMMHEPAGHDFQGNEQMIFG